MVLDDLLIASGVRMYVHHVTDTTGGQPVQAGTDTLDGDDVQVSCAGVVCTVHDGTAAVLSVPNLCPLLKPRLMLISSDRESISEGRKKNVHWETQGHLELATRGTTAARRPPSVKLFLKCPNSSCPNCSISFGRLSKLFAVDRRHRVQVPERVCFMSCNFFV